MGPCLHSSPSVRRRRRRIQTPPSGAASVFPGPAPHSDPASAFLLASPLRRFALASPTQPASPVSPRRRHALDSSMLRAPPASPPQHPSSTSLPNAVHTSNLPSSPFSSSLEVNQSRDEWSRAVGHGGRGSLEDLKPAGSSP
ncbi:hypothetical protein VPH35_053961 [Triticum aestivum]